MSFMRKGWVVCALVSVWVDASSANPGVFAANCTVPAHFALVGSNSGVPDGVGSFTIVVRDIANNPANGASVVIDLSNCADLALCSNPLDPSAIVNCAAKTERKFTDITGSVTFTLVGGSNGSGNASTLASAVKIQANGVPIGSPTASAFDLDGHGGVGVNDLSVWLSDYGAPGNPSYARSDFDGSGAVDVNDLSVWLTVFSRGGSTEGCAAFCP
jgi:hypothetical protein